MNKLAPMAAAIATALSLSAGYAAAADADRGRATAATAEPMMYGSQMMTPEERSAYGARMRAATTAEEREQIRREHHEQMKARAQARGMTLPEEPPMRGSGMGAGMGGMGPGSGMGPGGGMGSDGGRGR